MEVADLKNAIREVADFPKPGVNFYDVTTLFRNAAAFRESVARMVGFLRDRPPDVLVGIEARGFVLAAAMAHEMRLGLVLVRKFGKLPGETESESYELEYGQAHIEIHRDAVPSGQRVVIVDDLLATGGTASAAARLVERVGGRVEGFAFLVELDFLHGRSRLAPAPVVSLLHYPASGL